MATGVSRRHFAEVRWRGATFPLSLGALIDALPPPAARCLIPAERSRVVIAGVKRWPFDVTDAMVPHGENVTFFCKHPQKQCSFGAAQTCFDGKLQPPACYLGKKNLHRHDRSRGRRRRNTFSFFLYWTEPTWLQYKLFPHRLVSELEACKPGDLE